MSKLYIPSKKEIKGPWLLNRKQLEELNEILEFTKINLSESQRKEIGDKLKKRIEDGEFKDLDDAVQYERKFFTNEVKISVSFEDKNNKSLKGDSILDLLKDPHLQDFKPTLLKAEIEYGYSNKLELRVGKMYDGEFSFNLKAYDNDIEDEIKYKLESWSDDHKPSKASQIWLKYGFLIFMVSTIIFSFTAGFIYTIEEPNAIKIYNPQIKNLIETGITDQNQNEAIDLILKSISNYTPEDAERKEIFSPTAIKISGIAFLLIILSLIKPRTTLGIGRNKLKLLLYKRYIQVVLVTLPIIFIVTPLFDAIKKILGI